MGAEACRGQGTDMRRSLCLKVRESADAGTERESRSYGCEPRVQLPTAPTYDQCEECGEPNEPGAAECRCCLATLRVSEECHG